MKKKDILVLIGCSVVLIGSGIFIYFMIFGGGKSNQSKTTTTQEQKQQITGEIDTETLNKINELKDYGNSTLENIGRTDPFGQLN